MSNEFKVFTVEELEDLSMAKFLNEAAESGFSFADKVGVRFRLRIPCGCVLSFSFMPETINDGMCVNTGPSSPTEVN